MTYINLINPFVLTPSLGFLIVWAVKICVFYPLTFWGTFKHLGQRRVPFALYLVIAVIAFFLPFNFLLNDYILIALMISLYYFFANRSGEALTDLVATFSFSALLDYFAFLIGSYGLSICKVLFSFNGTPFYYLLVNFLVLICYGIALLLVRSLRPFFQRYLARLRGQHLLAEWLLSLGFLPLSYYLYYAQYHRYLMQSPTMLTGTAFHNASPVQIGAVSIFEVIIYVGLVLVMMELVSRYLANRDRANFADYRLASLTRYTSQLEVMNDDLRRFRHDYKNILYSLTSALETNNLDFAKRSLAQLSAATNKSIDVPTGIIGPLKNVQDAGLKAVIFNKISTAMEQKVALQVEIVDPIDFSKTMDPVDTIRIVAILLDNAIKAAVSAPQPRINLSLYENEFAQFIVVGNSTAHQVDLAALDHFSQTVSIIGNHHLGLRNLRIILARYRGASNDRRVDPHWFEQRIIIPKQQVTTN